MAGCGHWSPVSSGGRSGAFFIPDLPTRPATPPGPPPRFNTAPKPAPRHHKKQGTACSGNKLKTLECLEMPIYSKWPTGATLCLSAISAVVFTCALIFHGLMFYFSLDSPLWVVMAWPIILVPAIIFNSIYLAFMAKKVATTPNVNMVHLYVMLTMAYMSWATYVIVMTYKESKCGTISYYLIAVAVLGLATVGCAIEWWIAIYKIMQNMVDELSLIMTMYEKSPTKRKLVVSLMHNGNVLKESIFHLEKNADNGALKCTDQCMENTILFYRRLAGCGNKKSKMCLRKFPGQCSADGSKSTTCHYENEKPKQNSPIKYIDLSGADDEPHRKDADQYKKDKLVEDFTVESEADNSSFNSNDGQDNNA